MKQNQVEIHFLLSQMLMLKYQCFFNEELKMPYKQVLSFLSSGT